MALPMSTRLQYMVAPPPESRRYDYEDSGRFQHVLSDADRRLQEMEAQRILDRVRAHAAAHRSKRTWGARQPPDDSVRRSLSRPLLTPTLAPARDTSPARDALRSRLAEGLPSTAMLAPLDSSDRSPLRASASAARPSTAPVTSPLRPSRRHDRTTGEGGKPRLSAAHVGKLESEVSHLRDTINILLSVRSDGAPSSPSRPSAASPTRAKLEAVVEAHAEHMGGLERVLDEARAAEERVMSMQLEKRRVASATNRVAREFGVDVRRLVEVSAPARADGVPESKDAEASESKLEGEGQRSPAAAAAVRPASAAGRMQHSVTQTQDYSFMSPGGSSPHKITIAKQRALEDQRKRDAELKAHLTYKFRAKDIPDSTKLPLFSMIMARMETKRKLKHEARFAELQGELKPFHALMSHEEQMAARTAAGRARVELATTKELVEGRKFRANPVPPTTQNPDSEYMEQVARERDRPSRVAAHARTLAASASLPPRMSLAEEAEKKRKAARAAAMQQADVQQRRKSAFQANDMPNFDALHSQFTTGLHETRKAFAVTQPSPFRFDAPERKAAEKDRKTQTRMSAELATSTSQALRSRSLGPSASVDLGATGGSAFPLSAGTPARRRTLEPHEVSQKLAASNAPPAAMTRTVQLRMLEVQERVRRAQEAERLEAEAAEARDRVQRAATRAVAPVVAQLEAQRLPGPLAWQLDAETSAATAARQAMTRAAQEREAFTRSRIQAAQATRPMLMLRESVASRRNDARAAALHTAADATGAAASFDGAADVFTEDDRALMDMSRLSSGGGGSRQQA